VGLGTGNNTLLLYLFDATTLKSGTCKPGQVTTAGLSDAVDHGKDLWQVYGAQGKNPLLSQVSQEDVVVRTSPEERTVQVAAALLSGMGYTGDKPFQVLTSPSVVVRVSQTCRWP
jgi:hypothetical protein